MRDRLAALRREGVAVTAVDATNNQSRRESAAVSTYLDGQAISAQRASKTLALPA